MRCVRGEMPGDAIIIKVTFGDEMVRDFGLHFNSRYVKVRPNANKEDVLARLSAHRYFVPPRPDDKEGETAALIPEFRSYIRFISIDFKPRLEKGVLLRLLKAPDINLT